MTNIFEKINKIKEQISQANLKKSGKNSFAGFDYYELSDITPTIISACNKLKLFTAISFTNELATLTIINIEKPEEKVVYTSPMKDLQLKGCNDIQNLGGVETYSRRYLYLSAFDIVENDTFDATTGKTNNSSYISEQPDYKSMFENMLKKKYGTDNISIAKELNNYIASNSFQQSKMFKELKASLNK